MGTTSDSSCALDMFGVIFFQQSVLVSRTPSVCLRWNWEAINGALTGGARCLQLQSYLFRRYKFRLFGEPQPLGWRALQCKPGVLDPSHTPQVTTSALRGPQPTGEMEHGGKPGFRATTVPPSAAFIFHPNG